jgi:phospholipase/carboxylesterase
VSLEKLEVETGPKPTGTVIWMHGLGADGHDFEPIVPEIVSPHERALRFVFPHAPVRPVTCNGGYRMRAWYDIVALDRRAAEDHNGIQASDTEIGALIRRENERGIPTSRIVLAGFSQGGAMALYTGTRYPEKLAGIMGLSCYMLRSASFAAERGKANESTPIFLAHGVHDPVVELRYGEESRRLLESHGYPLEWRTYPMPHSVCPEEVTDIAAWLRKVL